jgi:hypothetical protein
MIETSANIANLAKALNAAQGAMTGVHKDGKNPHFKSRYATLENVIDTARPALNQNGLSWTQAPGPLVDGAITVTTMLMHVSGEWLRSDFHMPLAKRDPQSTGSAITYAQRYAMMAMLGLPPTDDDAEEASRPVKQEARQAPRGKDPADEYVVIALEVIKLATSADNLKAWWAEEQPHRSELGIEKGTPRHQVLWEALSAMGSELRRQSMEEAD